MPENKFKQLIDSVSVTYDVKLMSEDCNTLIKSKVRIHKNSPIVDHLSNMPTIQTCCLSVDNFSLITESYKLPTEFPQFYIGIDNKYSLFASINYASDWNFYCSVNSVDTFYESQLIIEDLGGDVFDMDMIIEKNNIISFSADGKSVFVVKDVVCMDLAEMVILNTLGLDVESAVYGRKQKQDSNHVPNYIVKLVGQKDNKVYGNLRYMEGYWVLRSTDFVCPIVIQSAE